MKYNRLKSERPSVVLSKHISHPILGVFQARNGPTLGKMFLLMLMVSMKPFGANLPKVPMLSKIYSVGR